MWNSLIIYNSLFKMELLIHLKKSIWSRILSIVIFVVIVLLLLLLLLLSLLLLFLMLLLFLKFHLKWNFTLNHSFITKLIFPYHSQSSSLSASCRVWTLFAIGEHVKSIMFYPFGHEIHNCSFVIVINIIIHDLDIYLSALLMP